MSKDTLLYSVTYFVVDVLCSIRSDTQQSTDCTLNLAFTAARRQQTDQRRQHFTPRSSVHARTVHQHFSSHLSLIMRLTASWTRTTDRPTTTIHNYYLYSPNWHHRHCIHVQLSKCDRFPELWVPVTSRYDTITQEAQNWCVGSSWRKQKKQTKQKMELAQDIQERSHHSHVTEVCESSAVGTVQQSMVHGKTDKVILIL